jgi:hypothetical protein
MGLTFAPGLPPLLLSLRCLILETWMSVAIVLVDFCFLFIVAPF